MLVKLLRPTQLFLFRVEPRRFVSQWGQWQRRLPHATPVDVVPDFVPLRLRPVMRRKVSVELVLLPEVPARFSSRWSFAASSFGSTQPEGADSSGLAAIRNPASQSANLGVRCKDGARYSKILQRMEDPRTRAPEPKWLRYPKP